MKKRTFSLLILLFSALSVFAEYNSANIPDSAEIRRMLVSSWFTGTMNELKSKENACYEDAIGTRFEVRSEEKDDSFAVIVSPESQLAVSMIVNDSRKLMKASVYAEGAQGSWVLFRDKKTGQPLRIQWYFNPDSDVYLQFRPSGSKTYVDMYVCGACAVRSAPLGIPFSKLYTASFQEVKKWTKNLLPWGIVSVIPGQYRDSLQMVGMIRENLPSITYGEDACYDEVGKLKSIITGKDFTIKDSFGNEVLPDISSKHILSGAGFLKWIIDGLIEPATGKGCSILSLTESTMNINMLGKSGVMSQQWNITFTLDWARNLAAKAMSMRSNKKLTFETGGVDVNYNLFVADEGDSGMKSSTGYLRNTGYEIAGIKSLLYVLGNLEPSWFYLAAVRQASELKPDELVFNNCAVLFPFFDDSGKFGCIVFDQGKEFTLQEFQEMYRNSYVHLERVKATEVFFPYSKIARK